MSSEDAASTAAEEVPSRPIPARRPSRGLVWVVVLAAGLAAGLGSWLLSEPLYGRLRGEPEAWKGMPTLEEANAHELKARVGIALEACVMFATLGAVLGASFGLAGGIVRRSPGASAAAGALGLVLGGLCGFAAMRMLIRIYFKLSAPDDTDLGLAIMVQGGVAAILGAAAGGAFGLGMGEDGRRLDLRCITGGLLGAFVGLAAYQLIGGVAFPMEGVTLPISTIWQTRLFAQAAIAVGAAAGVALARGSAAAPLPRVG